MKPLSLVVCAALSFGQSSGAEGKPLKVFILAGQSNMEGHAKIETFDYIGDDPATAPLLKMMRGADGKPAVCEGAWISYFTGSGENERRGLRQAHGGLRLAAEAGRRTAGRSGRSSPSASRWMRRSTEPVLIIKTAWGGKSLHTDFRPPSAGPYVLNDYQKKLYYGPPGHGVPEGHGRSGSPRRRRTPGTTTG